MYGYALVIESQMGLYTMTMNTRIKCIYTYIYICVYIYIYMLVILVSVFGGACLWELPHHYEESFGSNEMAGRIVKSSLGVM